MSPKNSGAPKKPRWSQAKKSAARRTDASPRPATRKPARRTDERDDTRRSGGGYPRRDDNAGGYPRRDDRAGGRPSGRPAGHGGRGRQEDVDGGWAAGRGRSERRDERGTGGYQGRNDRSTGGYRGRDDRSGGYQSRDDRGGYQRRDDRTGGGFRGRDERGNDRGFQRRDDRSGGYQGRDDRGGYQRRDDRSSGGYQGRSDRSSGGYQGRDDRGGYQRRDDRGGYQRRDDRSSGGYQGRDDRGNDRGYQRRDDRASGGYQRRDDRGGYQRRDDRSSGGYQGRDDRGPSRYQRDDRQNRYERRDESSRDERYPRRDDRPVRRDDRVSDQSSRPEHNEPRVERLAEGEAPTFQAPRREHRHAPADAPVARAEQLRRKENVAEPVDMATNGFAALGVPEMMVRRLARDGITAPFPIQEATIPDALAGRDVLGRGRTGSGKTLAFGLPMLARLAENGKATPNKPRAIVLSPTRELAMQISDALQPLVHVMGLRHKLVAGGMPYPPQFDALERGVDVLIATPGRLSDLIERGACSLEACQIVVLDEADHMADMGFLPEVTELMDQVPVGGQRLLFSATLDKGIDTLVEAYLNDPVTHSTDDAQASVTTMAHHVLLVDPAHKKVVTAHVANRGGHTIVFVRTKLGADRVAMQLREEGVFAAALHGGLSQAARNRVLAGFKDGTVPVLVATDVAARGIHVDDVGVVLQVDPPADHKDYLHRAGRTARAGEDGTVVTLALPHQKRQMQRIAEQAGVELTPERIAPGDARLHEITGSHRPDGPPIAEDRLRRLMEPPPRPRRGGGGGYRGGSGGRGGYRGGSGGGYRGGRGRD